MPKYDLKYWLDKRDPSRNQATVREMLQREMNPNRCIVHEQNFGQHMGILGSTGVGKSRLLMTIVSQFKFKLKQRCIFIDIKEELSKKLGVWPGDKGEDEISDILFSPFYEESVRWTVYNDIRTTYDLLAVSFAVVPDNPKDLNSYWVLSARAVAQAIMLFQKSFVGASNKKFLEYASDKNKLKALIADPKIRKELFETFKVDEEVYNSLANFIDSEGTGDRVGSTLGTLSSLIEPFKLLADMDGPFSFIDYIEDKEETRSIFFATPEHVKDSLMKLFRIPIEIMVKRVLHMDIEPDRRINLILDEFSGMGYMPTIIDAEGRGRSFGLRVMLAFQTMEDIKKSFGDSYKILVDNINTWAFYKTTSSKEVAELIGDTHYISANESHSSGANSVRDGVTVTRDFDKKKFAIETAEIQSLKPGECVLKLAGSSTVFLGTVEFGEFPERNIKFTERSKVIEVYNTLDNFEEEYEKKLNDPSYKTKADKEEAKTLEEKTRQALDRKETTGTEDLMSLLDDDENKEVNEGIDKMNDALDDVLAEQNRINDKLNKPSIDTDDKDEFDANIKKAYFGDIDDAPLKELFSKKEASELDRALSDINAGMDEVDYEDDSYSDDVPFDDDDFDEEEE